MFSNSIIALMDVAQANLSFHMLHNIDGMMW